MDGGGEELYLTNGSLRSLSEDLRKIELKLIPQDILSLKLSSKLGKSIDSTFILLDEGSFADVFGNYITSSILIKVKSKLQYHFYYLNHLSKYDNKNFSLITFITFLYL